MEGGLDHLGRQVPAPHPLGLWPSIREGRLDHLGRQVPAPHVDDHVVAHPDIGRQERQRDALAQHRREVAAGDHADLVVAPTDRAAVAGRAALLGQKAPQPPARPGLALGLQRGPAPEVALVPAHDPAQAGLERSDAGTQLVTVQGQPGLQAQGVARSQPGGRDPCVDQALPHGRGVLDADRHLHAVLAGVAGAGHGDRDLAEAAGRHLEPTHRGDLVAARRREAGTGLGTLHRDHGPIGGHVCYVNLARLLRQGADDPVGVGGIGHHVEPVAADPPHDDVVEHRGVGGVEQVGVLGRPDTDAVQVVGQRPLQGAVRSRTLYPHRSQMRDVEEDRASAAGHVLGHGARLVLQRHVPAPEGHQLRPGLRMHIVQRRLTKFCRHGGPAQAATPRPYLRPIHSMSRRFRNFTRTSG